MRLLFVTVGDTGRKVGGHLYNARLLAGLRARGIEVEEMIASSEDVEEQRVASDSLGERLALEEFDVVLVDALARIACAPHLDPWRGATLVVALVHELPSVARRDEAERAYEEPLLRADRLVCVSRHGASILEDRGVPDGRIHIVPPGLEQPPKVESNREDDIPRVLCVAQWIPRKNITGLVEAWTRLRAEIPDISGTLELIGDTDTDSDYAAGVWEAIARTGDVVVRGQVPEDELSRAYAAASVFALPSLYEGYGMVYAEAMSHGLPVVALDTGPVPEVVGDAGILVEPGDAAGLAEALRELLTDPELRHELSETALCHAHELPGWDEAADSFCEVLEAAIVERAHR